MTRLHPAWLAEQQRRWLRPNAHLYWRPDAARFLPAHVHHLLPPELRPSAQDGYDRSRPNIAAWTGKRGRWTPERAARERAEQERLEALKRREAIAERLALCELKSAIAKLRSDLAFERFKRAAVRWVIAQHLLRKAGFRPDQPRWPAGSGRISGRWSGGAGTGGPADAQDPDRPQVRPVSHRPPLVPKDRPPTPQQRNQILRELARLGPGAFWEALAAGTTWIAEEAASYFSYFDPPKTLQELQEAVYHPRRGYDIHHIVERHTAAKDGSEDHLMSAPENLVRIPRWKHWELNTWYETENQRYGGLTPREYLRGKSWQERERVGLEGLFAVGVLKR